jgi:hypothetical protein
MKSIAEVWRVDIVTLIGLLEPMHFDDGDRRGEIVMAEGDTMRMEMIRLRKPGFRPYRRCRRGRACGVKSLVRGNFLA